MKARLTTAIPSTALALMLFAAPLLWAQGTTTPVPQTTPQATTTQTNTTPPTTTQQQENAPSESVPLRVMVGKSLLVNTTNRLKRVSVTDPNVADAVVISPTQVLIHGRAPGEVSLVLWDEEERSRSFDLRVDVDMTAAREEIKRIFPDQQIDVSSSRSSIVLSGHVDTKDTADRAGLIAGAFSKNVVNVLTFGPVGSQEVLLEVHFAEVDRTAAMQLGVNLFSTGAANTFGASSTEQFGPPVGSKTGGVPAGSSLNGPVTGNHVPASGIDSKLTGQPAAFGFDDLLNIFLFRTDVNLGTVIKALQQKNILQILAEPNLIAVNGKEASFLAGGEFPIPVVQGGALQSVTILFKEFGVRLAFTPEIMANGNIHMRVAPEVSSLDFADGLRLSGFVVPALTTRRASTELELKDGQSFVIAGLLDNRVTNELSKVPGIGNIPILGLLFKSKNLQKTNTELVVLVTAHRISPSDTKPPLPNLPEKFMEPNKPGTDQKATPGAVGGKQ